MTTIQTLLDAMQVAHAAHDRAMDGFSAFDDHYDPATGAQRECDMGSCERLIAAVIARGYDPDDVQESLFTIVKDLRDMAKELKVVAAALEAATPEEEE